MSRTRTVQLLHINLGVIIKTKQVVGFGKFCLNVILICGTQTLNSHFTRNNLSIFLIIICSLIYWTLFLCLKDKGQRHVNYSGVKLSCYKLNQGFERFVNCTPWMMSGVFDLSLPHTPMHIYCTVCLCTTVCSTIAKYIFLFVQIWPVYIGFHSNTTTKTESIVSVHSCTSTFTSTKRLQMVPNTTTRILLKSYFGFSSLAPAQQYLKS